MTMLLTRGGLSGGTSSWPSRSRLGKQLAAGSGQGDGGGEGLVWSTMAGLGGRLVGQEEWCDRDKEATNRSGEGLGSSDDESLSLHSSAAFSLDAFFPFFLRAAEGVLGALTSSGVSSSLKGGSLTGGIYTRDG